MNIRGVRFEPWVPGGQAHHQDLGIPLAEARSAAKFPIKHLVNLCKRIVYNYFLRDFSLGSIQLV